jgi:predicted xylose isomerase-like sugar epimerase
MAKATTGEVLITAPNPTQPQCLVLTISDMAGKTINTCVGGKREFSTVYDVGHPLAGQKKTGFNFSGAVFIPGVGECQLSANLVWKGK